MRCLGCQYDLSNLVSRGGEHRCPECGRAFDPKDPTSFDQRLPLTMRDRVLAAAFILVIFSVCFWIALPITPRFLNAAISAIFGTIFVAPSLAFLITGAHTLLSAVIRRWG